MSEYELGNGYVLTDEEIEKRVEEWESGSWKGELVAVDDGNPFGLGCEAEKEKPEV